MTVRILFTTTARLGHFHPLVPLARAAALAGHEVAFACAQSLHDAVESSGFKTFSLGDDTRLDAELDAALQRMGAIPAGAPRAAAYLMEVFVGIEARRALPELLALCGRWNPDLIVREEYELAGAIAAEHLGLAHAVVAVAYASNWQQYAAAIPTAMQRLDELRATVGLAHDPELNMLYRQLYLSFDPPSLLEPTLKLPATARHLRPHPFDRSGLDALPDWVQTAPRPLIYASLGTIAPTMPNLFPAVYETLLEGLREIPGGVVMTVGRDRDPADLGAQPPNVHVERYIPQSLLLPHCDLIVTHGGHNSVLSALSLGLPMVIVPFFADQADNAARCAALGVGRVLSGRDLTPERLRDAAYDVLIDQRYRQNVRRIRDEIQTMPGLEEGVRLLEALFVKV
jgi:UDP:flavonoid glycosyltransferase YjiC (YdhE family)